MRELEHACERHPDRDGAFHVKNVITAAQRKWVEKCCRDAGMPIEDNGPVVYDLHFCSIACMLAWCEKRMFGRSTGEQEYS